MDQGCCEKSMRWDRQCKVVAHGDSHSSIIGRPNQYQSCPSFSSTLLDAIYRSIDEGGGGHQQHKRPQLFCDHETNTHTQRNVLKGREKKMGTDDHQRPYGVEKWIYMKGNEKVTVQWNSIANLQRSPWGFQNSSSSLSDSSSNKGRFSSSESDCSSHGESRLRSSSSCYSMKKLKPIRTSISIDRPDRPRILNVLGKDDNFRAHQVLQSNVHQQLGGVAKAKSKALKIYGEFKKVSSNNNKQPISPGSKLSGFLNSLFNAKKAKISSRCNENFPGKVPNSGYQLSTCSSASSFSRSCLSKTPSSGGKFSGDGTKRSVRFCPVSVVVDEDHRPCMQKTVPLRDHQQLSLRESSLKGRQVEESKVKNYPREGQDQELYDDEEQQQKQQQQQEEEEDDDDGASCASSDLFELENLSGIGGYRYSEELPVYETTNLDTNRAIANGFLV